MRAYARRTEHRLLWLVILFLLFVGGGLILIIYGLRAILTALPCLLAGAVVILALYGILSMIERWVKED